MLLRSISLNNVALYAGEHTIRFSTAKSKPITLIGGKNGAGKTTLLQSIPLALYGNRARHLLGSGGYPELLHDLIHRGEDHASVSLVFDRQERGETCTYEVTRSWTRSAGGRASEALDVVVNGRPRSDLVSHWAEYVEGILPLSVSGLAFFDGEKVEALADAGSSSEVLRTALHGLLGLDLIDRLERDLADYRRRVAAQVRNSNPNLRDDLERAKSALHVADAACQDAAMHHTKAHEQVEGKSQRLRAAQEQLARAGGGQYERRMELRTQLAASEANRSAAIRALEQHAHGEAPLLLVSRLLERISDAAERSSATEESSLLLERFKDRDEQLIAEASDVFDAKHLAALESMLARYRSDLETTQVVPFAVRADVGRVARSLLQVAGTDVRSRLSDDLDRLDESDSLARSTQRALDTVPAEADIATIVTAVATAEAELEAARRNLTRCELEMAECVRRADAARRDVDEVAMAIIDSDADGADAARLRREIGKAEATLGRFKERVVAKNIMEIGGYITAALQRLLRKKSLIGKVEILPETLELVLLNNDGAHVDPTRLSAGERQMLATATLWGLAQATGRTMPTVIDTPVGRLDRSHRTNLVDRYFPSASRQVVLLSTDEELVGEYYERLAAKVGQTYLLTYNPDSDATDVTEAYFS